MPGANKINYPSVKRDETLVENLHGQKVEDPYRWLEDPDAEETKLFVEKQNAITEPFLNDCTIKNQFYGRLKAMWDFPKFGCPQKRGDHYFYYHNSGLQNQSVLYIQDSLDGEGRVFLDPNQLSEDGTVSLSSSAYTEDGAYFAYGLSQSGSDWIQIKFKRVADNHDLPDVLKDVKFSSLAWTHDNKGIFYNRYLPKSKADGTETDSNVDQKLYYHVLGTSQDQDVLCAEFPEHPKWMIGAEVSDCGKYLVLGVREGCDPVNRLFFTDLSALSGGITGLLPFEKVVDNFDAEYDFVTNEGSVFTFKTNLNAPNYRLINIDFANYEKSQWRELVAEHSKDVLEWAACVNGASLVLCYLSDVKNVLQLADLASGHRLRHLPLDVGSVIGYSGRKRDTCIFYKFVSFLTPGTIYKCDLSSESAPEVFRETSVEGFDRGKFETSQVFYSSKDGTKIPMFLVHRKDLPLTGDNPVLLYGYGGFNISITPQFSVSRTVFMQHLGGVVAVPNIRGGGEYGETWHKAGCFNKKQNVFDDFQAAAQYLIDQKYTSASRLAINGGSNGGLLVGACANQRPDLFKCAVAQVGVLDMLRFHKFTIGHAWTTDYGCADKAEDFKYLIKYSPLHTVPDRAPATGGGYPATLLLTGDHDDRVVPLHSLKFIAELQHRLGAAENQTNPLLIRVDTKSGHGAGKPTAKVLEEVTDIYCFLYKMMDLQWQE